MYSKFLLLATFSIGYVLSVKLYPELPTINYPLPSHLPLPNSPKDCPYAYAFFKALITTCETNIGYDSYNWQKEKCVKRYFETFLIKCKEEANLKG